jgi:hypothetical protein
MFFEAIHQPVQSHIPPATGYLWFTTITVCSTISPRICGRTFQWFAAISNGLRACGGLRLLFSKIYAFPIWWRLNVLLTLPAIMTLLEVDLCNDDIPLIHLAQSPILYKVTLMNLQLILSNAFSKSSSSIARCWPDWNDILTASEMNKSLNILLPLTNPIWELWIKKGNNS